MVAAMTSLIVVVTSFVASILLLALIIQLTRHYQVLAHPNARSSHITATPTMGGLAIVIPVLALLVVLAGNEGLEAAMNGEGMMLRLLIAVTFLAVIGFLDDLKGLGANVRLLCQAASVALVLGAFHPSVTFFWLCVTGFLLLWHVNLYNFMDGIDGIAGVQTLLYCLGVLILADGVAGSWGLILWAISGATVGVLASNWPPARIFMGDVGALVLGLLLGVSVVALDQSDELPFTASIILLSGFWFDASYTLCVRMMTGQAFTQAHRSHLYQRVSDRLGHLGATSAFALLGVFWLLPLAWLSVTFPQWALACLLVAPLPYLVAAMALKAGLQLEAEDS
jgi:Fuc2NAc and GlcNAc transferase